MNRKRDIIPRVIKRIISLPYLPCERKMLIIYLLPVIKMLNRVFNLDRILTLFLRRYRSRTIKVRHSQRDGTIAIDKASIMTC